MPTKQCGVGVNPEALFAPSNGQFYMEKDMQRCFDEQQPITGPNLSRHLYPLPNGAVRPPLLRYGWIIGEKKFMQIILEYFPEHVICSNSLDRLVGPNKESRVITPYDVMSPHARWALTNPDLAEAICEKCCFFSPGIVNFSLMIERSNQSEKTWEVSIGTNYMGRLKQEYVQRVQAIFAPNTDPKWYLDLKKWEWTRPLPPCRLLLPL